MPNRRTTLIALAAAAHSLREQAERLVRSVGAFRLSAR